MKFDFSLWKDTGVRLLIDLAPAIVVTVGIEIYRSLQSPKGVFETASAFLTTLFFTGAYFSYLQRAKKHVLDSRNHDDVISKQAVVLTRLESLAVDTAGYTTGGDSYCYAAGFRRMAQGEWTAINLLEGRFPLHEVVLTISTPEATAGRMRMAQMTGDLRLLHSGDVIRNFGVVIPNLATPFIFVIPGMQENSVDQVIHMNWQARNGTWYQRVQFKFIDGFWRSATFVKRGVELVYSNSDREYPRDSEGNPLFTDPSTLFKP